jgi:hypothetical protein
MFFRALDCFTPDSGSGPVRVVTPGSDPADLKAGRARGVKCCDRELNSLPKTNEEDHRDRERLQR